MRSKPKPVPEMDTAEYQEYLLELEDNEFMHVVAHDIRKSMSIVHGYLSLIQLDLEEGVLQETLGMYLEEMEKMVGKSYMYLDAAEEVYDKRL